MEGFGVEDFREAFCFLEVFGATRRDRTGDLLITKPYVSSPMCNYFSLKRCVFQASSGIDKTPENCGKQMRLGLRADKTADKAC